MFFLVFSDEFYVKNMREVLSEVVAGAHLKRFPVGHHCLQRGCVESSSELFAVAFNADKHWNCQVILHQVLVLLQDVHNFFLCFFTGCVRSVPFLPEELSGSEKKFGGFCFPADNVAPLVYLDWQGSPASNPLGQCGVPNRFRGGSNS